MGSTVKTTSYAGVGADVHEGQGAVVVREHVAVLPDDVAMLDGDSFQAVCSRFGGSRELEGFVGVWASAVLARRSDRIAWLQPTIAMPRVTTIVTQAAAA